MWLVIESIIINSLHRLILHVDFTFSGESNRIISQLKRKENYLRLYCNRAIGDVLGYPKFGDQIVIFSSLKIIMFDVFDVLAWMNALCYVNPLNTLCIVSLYNWLSYNEVCILKFLVIKINDIASRRFILI